METYNLYLDERQKDSIFYIGFVLVKQSEVARLDEDVKRFKQKIYYPEHASLHYFKNSKSTRQEFARFIKLRKNIVFGKVKSVTAEFPINYINCYQQIASCIAQEIASTPLVAFQDEVSGPKTQKMLKRELKNIFSSKGIVITKQLKFINSKNSTGIQIADYACVIG